MDTVQLDRRKVAAFVTDLGGKTSHAAIMASSLQIPAVVGLTNITRYVKTGDELIVDGKQGKVYVHPSDKLKRQYQKYQFRSVYQFSGNPEGGVQS